MTDITDDPRFQRDREIYRVISSSAPFHPIAWAVLEAELAALQTRIDRVARFEQAKDAFDADEHAPLLRAIKQSSWP